MENEATLKSSAEEEKINIELLILVKVTRLW